ncbi:MAG: hypothetical protein KA791_03190 [Flavobacteriales bacterium]|nr:hypothetical protein [Flavobacteriales bacterium]
MTDRAYWTSYRRIERVVLSFACALVCGAVAVAQAVERRAGDAQMLARNTSPTGFEENKGQVKTTQGEPAPFVHFRLCRQGTNIFLLDRGIAYQFVRTHEPAALVGLRSKHWRNAEEEALLDILEKEVRLETYRMDVELEGAARNASISTEGRSIDHTNYYNHDALDVHTYSRVTYHDVYPLIDWSITATEAGIEYDFIVRPGGDPSRIRMLYTDHEELLLNEAGELIHGNRLGHFTEAMPVSYQEGRTVPTHFELRDDVVSFAVGAYDKRRTLLIDPPRQWGTYYGGSGGEYSISVDTDASGNVYLAGWTSSTGAIATPGSQQQSGAGQDDGMLVKFNGDGVRQWGTYYGGSQADAFSACSVDGSSVYAAGMSRSAELATVYQLTWAGDWDGLLVKFNAQNGLRQWSTYYGGSAEDRGRGCDVDAMGNVFLSGLTYSDEVGAIGSGGHQNTRNGDKDGFLVKFSSTGVRVWGTYYGGTDVDESFGCATDANGSVYLCGGTGSVAGTSIATAGGHQPGFGGMADAYLAKFNAGGVRQWGTYYGGVQSDYGFACTVDASGNAYLTGDTFSGESISTAGAHQAVLGGGRDAFLVKFNAAGARLWGTYYGGVNFESGRGCSTDAADRVLLAGETESSSGIAANGHQMSYGGGEVDGYLAEFDGTGYRISGTYYGGTSRDEAYGAVADGMGNIYLVGRTLSTNAISASGAHQSTLAGLDDAFLVKFGEDPDCLGVPGGPSIPGSACDDADPCTINDVYTTDCVCSGTLNGSDLDADGVPDCADDCPTVPGQIGSPCDDGNPETINDLITSSCYCSGAPSSCTMSTDCDDLNDCTYDQCIDMACVYTPIQLGPIDGPADVEAPGSYTYVTSWGLGIYELVWSLPDGWSSPDIYWDTLEVDIGFVPSGEVELCVSGLTNTCVLDTCLAIIVHSPIGFDEYYSSFPTVLASPNPSTGVFIINIPEVIHGKPGFIVSDVAGRSVDARIVQQGPDTWSIRLVNAPPGAYQLIVEVYGQHWSSRLLISP